MRMFIFADIPWCLTCRRSFFAFRVLTETQAEAEFSMCFSHAVHFKTMMKYLCVSLSLSITAHGEEWSLKRPSAARVPTIPHFCGWHDILTWSDQDKQRYWPLAEVDFLLFCCCCCCCCCNTDSVRCLWDIPFLCNTEIFETNKTCHYDVVF